MKNYYLEVRGQRSENGIQKTEIKGQKIIVFFSVFCLLSSVFCGSAYSFFPFGQKPKTEPKKQEVSALTEVAEPALTLEQAYRLALKQSEDVAMKEGELGVAQGHVYQALNEVMPDVSFLMTESIQDAPGKGESSGGSEGVSSNFTRRTTPQKKFTLHQPIFSGFKEIAGIQGSGAEKAQKKYEKIRVEETLLTDVVSAFYSVILAEKDVKTLEETKTNLENRMKDLKERVDLGRSRENELQTALSDKKQVEAELVSARSDAVIARQELEYYIGRPVTGSLADPENSTPDIREIEVYLDKTDLRPDVKAASEAYTLAEKKVTVAQSGLFPSAYLDGNYYTQRVGFQSGIDWDVLLSVNVPVFNGTETIGDIKVAASEKEMAKYSFLKTKRLARLDIYRAYEGYRSAKLEEAALAEAVEAKKKDYELQTEDYKLNLVNNLEVLTSLKNYQDLSRQFNAAHYDTKKKYWQLQVAVGETMDLGKEK